jgi:6-phosphofructokinase 1
MMGVRTLGPASVVSPLRSRRSSSEPSFTPDGALVRREIEVPEDPAPGLPGLPEYFEKAGPRASIYFEPRRATVGILTAGGLCPGLNDVVRSTVLELHHGYGVARVLGFRFGFAGLDPSSGHGPILLTPEAVRDIHLCGGTMLGTSRASVDPAMMVETLQSHGVGVLLAIGGDGTMRGAHAIHEAARSTPLGVIGIPKTIDNDIPFVDKTFGFDSAVATAREAIDAAHAEARSAENGIGLVKLMGRHAGFIAAHSTLASRDVNACIVPEVPFRLERVLEWLEGRLASRGHAVVVVAEGCAEALATKDLGAHLRTRIETHFLDRRERITLKYIDPSYMLRGRRSTSEDAVFCDALARNAVHAAMAGKTDILIGRWHRCFTHVGLDLVLAHRKALDPRGELWRDVLESTGQPSFV